VSTTDVSNEAATQVPETRPIDMRLEVVVVPVSDVERAKQFYASLGWREDADVVITEDYRVLQFTPTGSQASIIFGTGVTDMAPGSIDHLLLAVDDVDAARAQLLARGVEVSEVFHDAGGGLGGGFHPGTEGRAPGPDPEGRSYGSYASFSDPDGNGWLLQEITERLPGRV
jgi:catechol 2,3-dioxygenase-like lactoylglutathione lyase family enzyme